MSSWQDRRLPHTGQLLPLPEDGVAISTHPPSWLGRRWRGLLDQAPRESTDRINRGRNYARRGRLRALDVAPGCASAEVHCADAYRPTLRIRPFSKQEWTAIVHELTADLDLIASLLEGDLPQHLVDGLREHGISLLPSFDELDFDCDCGDYVMPCTHVCTVFHVLTDALDGDPFLLLTLRGRDREQLLATLRSDWGDDAPLHEGHERLEEPPPEGDWYRSAEGVVEIASQFTSNATVGAGLRALGPPPGEDSLVQTLAPLYQGAQERVNAVLEAIPDRVAPRRRAPVARVAEPPAPAPALEEATAEPRPVEVNIQADLQDVTERLVAGLSEMDGATSIELSKRLGLSVSRVRAELVDLLALGMVYRSQLDGTVHWHLG